MNDPRVVVVGIFVLMVIILIILIATGAYAQDRRMMDLNLHVSENITEDINAERETCRKSFSTYASTFISINGE